MPIHVVALRVGFQTQGHFTQLFRHLTGRTPTAYRHEHRAPAVPPRAWTVGREAYETLSLRERALPPLLAAGQTHREIAATWGISPRTVETHCAHLKQKLGLRTQGDVIRYALQHGLVPLTP